MTTLIYIIVGLLLAVSCEAKPIDDSNGIQSFSDSSPEPVASSPVDGTYYSDQLQKFSYLKISSGTKLITFYTRVQGGMPKASYDCHFTYKSGTVGYKMTLTDGYDQIIKDSHGFYDKKLISGISGKDTEIISPNADGGYQRFVAKQL